MPRFELPGVHPGWSDNQLRLQAGNACLGLTGDSTRAEDLGVDSLLTHSAGLQGLDLG